MIERAWRDGLHDLQGFFRQGPDEPAHHGRVRDVFPLPSIRPGDMDGLDPSGAFRGNSDGELVRRVANLCIRALNALAGFTVSDGAYFGKICAP